MAAFMPAVLYSKEADGKSGSGGVVTEQQNVESAKILKGDHIVAAHETFKQDKAKRR